MGKCNALVLPPVKPNKKVINNIKNFIGAIRKKYKFFEHIF
jgi:hypothetical protein